MYSHYTAQRIQCASIRKTKQLYELDLLTCAGFEEKIHPTYTGLQVFNTNLPQTNVFYIHVYHRVQHLTILHFGRSQWPCSLRPIA